MMITSEHFVKLTDLIFYVRDIRVRPAATQTLQTNANWESDVLVTCAKLNKIKASEVLHNANGVSYLQKSYIVNTSQTLLL
jgi:hypothetical protein